MFLYMGFWAKVSQELAYRSISRKELAYRANIKEITIHKAIERDSVPSADTALRISKILNVSLEYLLDMEDINENMQENYGKYKYFIYNLEKLPLKDREAIIHLVDILSK